MKMPEAIGSQLFAPCGMNCMVCFTHCSTKKACGGCLGTDESKPGHCRTVCERTVLLKESYPTAMNAAISHAEGSGIWTEAIANAMASAS